MQYLAVLALSTLLAVIRRYQGLTVLGTLLLYFNAATVFEGIVPPTDHATGSHLRVLMLNVHTENRQTGKVIALVRSWDPDMVGLMEVNDRWVHSLTTIRTHYPHHLEKPRPDNFGIALYSKRPWRDARIVWYGPANIPSVQTRTQLPSDPVTLLFTHPVPPTSRHYTR